MYPETQPKTKLDSGEVEQLKEEGTLHAMEVMRLLSLLEPRLKLKMPGTAVIERNTEENTNRTVEYIPLQDTTSYPDRQSDTTLKTFSATEQRRKDQINTAVSLSPISSNEPTEATDNGRSGIEEKRNITAEVIETKEEYGSKDTNSNETEKPPFEDEHILTEEVFDEVWYGRLESSLIEPVYEYFEDSHENRDYEKELFLSGEIRNPSFAYPKINRQELYEQQRKLQSLKEDILKNETNHVVKEAYRWKINSEIMANRLLLASADGDMEMFKLLNEYVYGAPSQDIFNLSIIALREELNTKKEGANEDLLKAITDLEEALPSNIEHPRIVHIPTQEEISLVRSTTNYEMGDILNIENPKGIYSSADIQKEFQNALRKMELEDWKVKVDSGSSRSSLSVNHKLNTVFVPESRQLLHQEMQNIIAHEIGTHVARRENGTRSKLKLLGIGLDRYEKGEEGIATMREQALSGEGVQSLARADGHLTISLAYGLDGRPRDFRETYEIMKKYYMYEIVKEGIPSSLAEPFAEDTAWQRTVRAFRGSDCETPGAVFTKDIVYAEGNYDIWNLIREKPEELLRFSVGKYDPTNPRHIWIISQLGITEEDLEIYKNKT